MGLQAGLLAALGVLLLRWCALLETVAVPWTPFRIATGAIAMTGALVIVLGILSSFWAPRFAMASLATCLALWILVATGGRPPERGDREIAFASSAGQPLQKIWDSDTEWHENYIGPDEVLGFRGSPSIAARHFHPDFGKVVTYTMGPDGWRLLPTSAAPKAPASVDPRPILFLGCSYTFGSGVEDSQSFPALLAAGPWRNFIVQNHAFPAFDTAHACAELERTLRDQKPLIVFYGMIGDHPRRNDRRRTYHASLNQPFPHFDVHQGKLVHLGLAAPSLGDQEASPELDAKEVSLTVLLIDRMRDMCRTAGVPFQVLGLTPVPSELSRALAMMPNLAVRDFSDVDLERYPTEGHPIPAWHREIARLLASDPGVARLAGRPELFQPSAFPMTLDDWFLCRGPSPATAKLSLNGDPAVSLRVQIDRDSSAAGPFNLELASNGMPPTLLSPGCDVVFSLRADAPRSVELLTLSCGKTRTALAPARQVQIDQAWREIQVPCISVEPGNLFSVRIVLGNSIIPVELKKPRTREARPQSSRLPNTIKNAERSTDTKTH